MELWRLARSSAPDPMNHVAVVTSVRVQGELVVSEKAPPFSVREHSSNLPEFRVCRSLACDKAICGLAYRDG
jgi:surface antigen